MKKQILSEEFKRMQKIAGLITESLKEYTEEVDTLALTFKDSNEFEKAKEHFESNSDFYPYEINDEFRTFHFEVQDQVDADSTEFYLNQELEGQTDLQGYYFSTESSLDENLEEGWKTWALGGLMSLATLAGIGKAYVPNIDSLSQKDEIELAQNAYRDALKNMSKEDVDTLYSQVNKSNIKDDLKQNKFTISSTTSKETIDAAWPDMQRASLETAISKNLSRFVIDSTGSVVFISNPSGFTAIKEENISRISKSDFKNMIREMALAEAKKDKEEDVEIEDTETVDTEETPTEDTPEGNPDDILDALKTALNGAKALGDEKLTDQIGNTITFYTRVHIVGQETDMN